RVEQKVDRLGEELGGLKATIGSSLEDEASSMLEFVMRQKGYRLLSEAVLVRLNGEVDAALKAVSPEGEPVSVVMESKARLGARDVIRWSQRMRSADFQKRLAKAGYPAPYLVYAYGIRVDAAARQAVQETGIGLIRGEGEVFAPREWVGKR
ncbi:MAG: hypothetical protein N2117_09745, partial [Anaerolineales bacterium]|nr:hypothetical protein [Anaerolineales bacterium]